MSKIINIKKLLISVTVFFAVAISMALLLPYNTIETEAAKKITEADIQALKDKISNNQKKIDQYKTDISEIGNDIKDATKTKELLDQQINAILTNIDSTEELIQKYELLIRDKEIRISDSESQISEKYNDFLERLRISYEDGSQNYLELLISSENLIDFITRIDNLGSILTYEQGVMNDLDRHVSELNSLKASLELKKAEYQELGSYQSQSQEELEKKLEESEDLIKRLQDDEEEAKKAHQSAVKNDSKLDKELKELIEKYQQQQNASAKESLLWPLDPSNKRISSKYGWRMLWGEKDYHLGIDLPAAYKSNIYAANDGEVLKARYDKSYGYYILISHGGDKSTLYAHCSKLLVKAGDKVKRGDVIGLVGSTGNSSGYHLHFEVRINGNTTNPLVKNMLVIKNNGKYVDPVAKNLLKYD